MVGTGDVATCQKLIKEMLFDGCDLDAVESGAKPGLGCGLDAVRHPPIDRSTSFVAMSVYFFALDALRVITEAAEGSSPLPHWPSPTVSEVLTVAERFCAMEWSTV